MKNSSLIKEIVEGIASFKIIPFFGAGMSKPCGTKDWKEIINALSEELGTAENDYLKVAQSYEDQYGREQLIARLKSACVLTKTDSAALRNHLMILGMNPPIIYTTNYDNAIEEAAAMLNKDYKKIVSLKDIRESPHGQKQIIKFHGDFSDNDSIVFTANDYIKRLEVQVNPLDVNFRSNILGKSLLFLGYGFGDKNIKLIYDMHRGFYGTNNIPKSYIISFGRDDAKEEELKAKNIVTLKLSGPDELLLLIEEISGNVFQKVSSSHFEGIFHPLPSVVLTVLELKNLEVYVDSSDFSDLEKKKKIRTTLEGRTLATDTREAYIRWVKKIVFGAYPFEVKESMMLSFQHVYGLDIVTLISICFDLMYLTDDPLFLRDLDNWGLDVISVIERQLGNLIKSSVEVRKWICRFVLGYMEGMISEGKKLLPYQIERLLDALKTQRYQELGDIGCGFNQQSISETLEKYLGDSNPSVRHRFEAKPFFRRNTITEIQEKLLEGFPEGLIDL